MKVQQCREPIIGLLMLSALSGILNSNEPSTVGFSVESSSRGYWFSAGTGLWALLLAGLIACAYYWLMKAQPSTGDRPVETVLRRFVAVLIDSWLAGCILAPILGLPPVLVEWRRTGQFAWTFERTELAPTDLPLQLISMPIAFAGMLLYFAIPLLRRRPTPGACIAGYQVLPDEDQDLTFRQALGRTFWGFIALCAAWAAPFIGRDRALGKIWIDKRYGTSAKWLD